MPTLIEIHAKACEVSVQNVIGVKGEGCDLKNSNRRDLSWTSSTRKNIDQKLNKKEKKLRRNLDSTITKT